MPGEKIVREGDSGDEMYIILQGKVSIEVGDIIVGEMGSGDFFGEMSLIDNAPRSATVTAQETTLLFAINEKISSVSSLGSPLSPYGS